MIHSKNKGNRTVKKAVDYLITQGYEKIEKVEKTGKFVKEKDLFGLFDLIAIQKKKLIFVQVKTNATGGAVKAIRSFSKKYKLPSVKYWVMTWYDRKGWVIHKIWLNKEKRIDEKYKLPKEEREPEFKCWLCNREKTETMRSRTRPTMCIWCAGEGS